MFEKVNFNDFCDRFKSFDRENSFTYAGKKALFEYLEEIEESDGKEMELDIVAIDCDFTEYTDAIEAWKVYNLDEIAESEEKCLEWLQENTQVIVFDSGIIIQNF